jgi:hypothetical protein
VADVYERSVAGELAEPDEHQGVSWWEVRYVLLAMIGRWVNLCLAALVVLIVFLILALVLGPFLDLV